MCWLVVWVARLVVWVARLVGCQRDELAVAELEIRDHIMLAVCKGYSRLQWFKRGSWVPHCRLELAVWDKARLCCIIIIELRDVP